MQHTVIALPTTTEPVPPSLIEHVAEGVVASYEKLANPWPVSVHVLVSGNVCEPPQAGASCAVTLAVHAPGALTPHAQPWHATLTLALVLRDGSFCVNGPWVGHDVLVFETMQRLNGLARLQKSEASQPGVHDVAEAEVIPASPVSDAVHVGVPVTVGDQSALPW